MEHKEYWEIHGTRRPFPSLYRARELYGEQAIAYYKPRFEKDGQCPWCGQKITWNKTKEENQ